MVTQWTVDDANRSESKRGLLHHQIAGTFRSPVFFCDHPLPNEKAEGSAGQQGFHGATQEICGSNFLKKWWIKKLVPTEKLCVQFLCSVLCVEWSNFQPISPLKSPAWHCFPSPSSAPNDKQVLHAPIASWRKVWRPPSKTDAYLDKD